MRCWAYTGGHRILEPERIEPGALVSELGDDLLPTWRWRPDRDEEPGRESPTASEGWVVASCGREIARPAWSDLYETRECWPMQVPALHRRFAEVSDDPSVVAFADQHGFLGRSLRLVVPRGGSPAYAEPLSLWLAQAALVRELVALWDSVRGVLGAEDERGPARVEGLFPTDLSAAIAKPRWRSRKRTSRKVQGPGGDATNASLEALVKGMNGAMLSTVSAQILRVSLQPVLVPRCLLGAIHLQLANEILGRTEPLKRCEVCGKWFASNHARRAFCSDACRVKAYRDKKKEMTEGE